MNPALILVISLSSAAWQCDNREGLWECRPPQATVPGQAARRVATDSERDTDGPATAAAPPAPTTEPPEPVPRDGDASAGYAAPTTGNAEDMEAAATNTGESAAASADAWVVQIAAYRDKAAAQAAAREINYAGLIIMPIRREDEDWFVLLLGAYEKKADAEQAGKAY
ncbi:MAG: SPOR domain-containing protein, partial [Halieaceae bacterium]|nr:SPOR domain-containing protein [Halieaceae bacterium]